MTPLGTGVPWSHRPDDLQEGMAETLRRLAATAEDGTAGECPVEWWDLRAA